MQVLLLVLFVAYLYVPYLLFKFFVEESVDLIRRKDLTRVEEFFAAALPSALLNGATYLTLMTLHWTRHRVGFGINFPPIDWKAVSGLLDPQLATVRIHVASGMRNEATYLLFLFGISCFLGKVYGIVELRLLERGAATTFFSVGEHVQNHARWFVALIFRRIWLPFFAESFHPLTPWTVKDTWLFVRTKDDRLFYGFLWEYMNDGAGNVESVTLIRAQRYARTPVPTCLAAGRCPLSRLSGSLVIKWSEIADINIASPDVMRAIRRKYAVKLRTWRSARFPLRSPEVINDVAANKRPDDAARQDPGNS